MIDFNLYRSRVGVFNLRSKPRRRSNTAGKTGNCIPNLDFLNHNLIYDFNGIRCLPFILYLYYILILMLLTMSMILDMTDLPKHCYCSELTDHAFFHVHVLNVKLLYVLLIWFLIKQVFSGNQGKKEAVFHSLYLPNSYGRRHRSSKFCRLLVGICYWSLLLNFLAIVIVNPSLLNPGPIQNISVAYQNVQGLIPFSQLENKCPTLDTTKISELNSYIYNEKPGIIILNETWLKRSISDNELLPTNDYKVFRVDRTDKTHPPDPDAPNRFRRNGGGVLIGLRRDLDVISTKIEIKCRAEILGVTLKFSDGRKFIICTCYRVGTLGSVNHTYIDEYLRNLRMRRGISNICLVGDFNMRHTHWQSLHSSDSVEQSFINTFSDLGFTQLVSGPTHYKGNTLDIVLTNNQQVINDITVDSNFLICKSDYYPILFNVFSNVKRKKAVKREIFNFKRANWAALNNELRYTDWNTLLTVGDIDDAWSRFKNHLFECCNRHIPKIKIKGEFQPPWFDSETHDLCRQKERLRSRYKQTKSTEHYLKYSDCRRKFKNLVKQKMKDK